MTYKKNHCLNFYRALHLAKFSCSLLKLQGIALWEQTLPNEPPLIGKNPHNPEQKKRVFVGPLGLLNVYKC